MQNKFILTFTINVVKFTLSLEREIYGNKKRSFGRLR